MDELSSLDQQSDAPLPGSKAASQDEEAKYDNFFSPQNIDFYSKFRYSDLDFTEQTIRLLRIHPLSSDDDESAPIICDLIDNFSLLAKPDYTTISYCAGDPKNTERIIVNGLEFNAFSNLAHALRQARHFWKRKFGARELLLWADQVCINQSNPSERSHQVSFMGSIYASGEQVLVCLSTDDDTSEWLHNMSRSIRLNFRNRSDAKLDEENEKLYQVLKVDCDNEDQNHEWDVFFSTVLTSPWWSRAWVRQEFIRSPQAYFLAKFKSIHWKSLVDVHAVYFHSRHDFGLPSAAPRLCSPSSYPTTPRRCSAVCQACNLGQRPKKFWDIGKCVNSLLQAKVKIESQPGYFPDLLYNLRDAHLCKSSDTRDLVYAFIGISAHSYGIYPDYSQGNTIEDVFTKLACNVISYSGNLGILEMAYMTRTNPTIALLDSLQEWGRLLNSPIPSWVPDWRTLRNPPQNQQTGELNSPGGAKIFFSLLPDEENRKDRILQVRGVFYDTLGPRMLTRPRQFFSRKGGGIPTTIFAEKGDEIWMLHGSSKLFILRRHKNQPHRIEESYQVVGEVVGTDGMAHDRICLFQKVNAMAKSNDPSLKIINIC